MQLALILSDKTFRQYAYGKASTSKTQMSRDMRFPTVWYVPSQKPQISLRIRTV